MPKSYDYALAVWLRLGVSCTVSELREHLETEYQVLKLETLDESEATGKDEFSFLMQLQCVFDESQMDDDEPTEEAIDALDEELSSYIDASYQLKYLEILDDALTSYLLGESDDSEE